MPLLTSIELVTVALSPVVITVPDVLGKVTVGAPPVAEALTRMVPEVVPRITMPEASTSIPFLNCISIL